MVLANLIGFISFLLIIAHLIGKLNNLWFILVLCVVVVGNKKK